MSKDKLFVKLAKMAIACAVLVSFFTLFGIIALLNPTVLPEKQKENLHRDDTLLNEGNLIYYGRQLVEHTSVYLGPRGKVRRVSNGMNCQNCHLEAGTKFYGNNYLAVASTYPKFRARSGTIESIEKRINDCIERSLNGAPLPLDSREIKAFVAYIKWLGKGVEKGKSPRGTGIYSLPFMDRPADRIKGKLVYTKHCSHCHGYKGHGLMKENALEWKYPPLWGDSSFNTGAGLYRLSRMAGYVKVNMPNNLATYEKPVLSDHEAWDVSAYIISLPRPTKDISNDWPDISKKPVDHPFAPYSDSFSETQHKYGPFDVIESSKKRSSR